MSNEQKTAIKPVKRARYGLVVGWMVGMLWHVSMVVAFAAMSYGTRNSEVAVWHQGEPTVWSTLAIGPLVAIPWAIVGGMVGAVIGSKVELLSVLLGLLGGICLSLLGNPFDGWLTVTVPIGAFVGTFIGLAGGCLISLVSKVGGLAVRNIRVGRQ
jgi:hypothetical protein